MNILKNLLGNNSKIHVDEIAVLPGLLLGKAVIVESGNNANGEYIKYGDGTMLAWKFLKLSYSAANFLEDEWTYPAAFHSNVVTIANRTARYSYGRMFSGSIGTSPNNNSCLIRLYKTVEVFQAGDTEDGHVIAIGRWKA